MAKVSIEEQIEIFKEGCVDFISENDLREKLKSAEKERRALTIKYGADPSASDIHLGHTVPLRKLRALQDIGHQVLFLIGDFTAMIGDPTGRSETRKMLTPEDVKQNALTYQEQVFKILDKEKTRVVYNSEWLSKISTYDFLLLTSKYTVARVLERDDFKKRFSNDLPISLLEFMYPLLQGYDSVYLKNDIEIGGTDQKFNLLVGRHLQKDYGVEPQVVMTLPLIEGTDGVRKMSKSFGNSINVHDRATDMFGKIMSIPDELIKKYFLYLTSKTEIELNEMQADMDNGELNPRDAKVALAKEIISFYYSNDDALRAEDEFKRVFRNKGLPDDIPVFEVEQSKDELVSLLARFSVLKSKGEARRLIKQGAVKVDGNKVLTIDAVVEINEEVLVQCGKRIFVKFKCG